MKKLNQAAKVIRLVLPLILLLSVNGCGDMSGTDQGGTGEDAVQQAIAVGSSYWTNYFSDENPAGFCNDGYLVTGMQCSGRYCDNMRMLCTYVGQNSYIYQTLSTFSEESTNYRICNDFVTQIKCSGDYCDNLTLSCSKFNYLARNSSDCYWTSSFSEEQSAMYLKSGYYLAGVKCTGSYCDNISMYACRATPTTDAEPISNPTECYNGLCPNYSASAPDSDGDGIPDNVENYLLAKFSPFFMFSVDAGRYEHFNPTDPVWYLDTSTFLGVELWDAPTMPIYFGYDITKNLWRYDACIDPGSADVSSYLDYCCPIHDAKGYSLAFGDEFLNWSTIMNLGNVGLFGHVVPSSEYSPSCLNDRSLSARYRYCTYKIEYWQFFAWNDGDQPHCITNHQADWTSIQLKYDRHTGKIFEVNHYVHGKKILYSLASTQVRSRDIVYDSYLKTDKYSIYPEDFWRYMEYRGPNYGKSFNEAGNDAQNNTLRILQDPYNGQYNHPMVYIEYGAHEFWPTAYGDITQYTKSSPKHGGGAYRFLTKSIPNLGEVESANMPSEIAKFILRFNGEWGCHGNLNSPPPGPPLHKSWTWPPGSPLKTRLDNNKVNFE